MAHVEVKVIVVELAFSRAENGPENFARSRP
ncbi:MAG: hypothetical protein ACI8W7_003072, partial [Gammaproteobacteria bacterium]